MCVVFNEHEYFLSRSKLRIMSEGGEGRRGRRRQVRGASDAPPTPGVTGPAPRSMSTNNTVDTDTN